ncbi:MAG: alkaline phosphatase family protein, partial [Tumebacillaceae bacterium]
SQFVLLDNFYADAEVSAQGHNWAVGAKANDYVEKNWPANYSDRNRVFDFEGDDQATYPKAGFLWNEATRSNVTFRDYGEFYRFDTAIPNDPTIGNRYDPHFIGWDLKYSDVDRYKEWAREFEQFEEHDNLPQLEIVRLPNDHTAGTRPGFWTPQSMMAQNDYALGLLVDTVSRSKYWKDTAIFITEDDAQAGVDHVDSHRTISLVVSPYTQTHKVDSTVYDTTSMLRTMELILGMKPLTQYDAAATPMLNVFTDKPNFDPYEAMRPTVAIDRLNTKQTIAARASELLDFSEEDKADEMSLNHILWQAVRGNQPYPNRGNVSVDEDDDDEDK